MKEKTRDAVLGQNYDDTADRNPVLDQIGDHEIRLNDVAGIPNWLALKATHDRARTVGLLDDLASKLGQQWAVLPNVAGPPLSPPWQCTFAGRGASGDSPDEAREACLKLWQETDAGSWHR